MKCGSQAEWSASVEWSRATASSMVVRLNGTIGASLAKRAAWIQRGFRVELNCGSSEHIDNERDSTATWKSVLLVPSVTVEQ